MFGFFISGNYIEISREKDEDDYMFSKRIKYIYDKIKECKIFDESVKQKIIKDSLYLKNKCLYNVSY